jgi:hypothetical protein
MIFHASLQQQETHKEPTMRTKSTFVIGGIALAFTIGLAAQVAQTRINRAQISWKKQPPLLRLKSGGEVVAELQVLKPAKLKVDGGVESSATGSFRSKRGAIEITPEGMSPWRISGTDVEIEVVEKKPDAK